MDIKEIALRLLAEEFPGMHQENQAFMVEFAEALISAYKAELLNEVGEPVLYAEFAEDGGWLGDASEYADHLEEPHALFTSDQVAAAILKETKPLEEEITCLIVERDDLEAEKDEAEHAPWPEWAELLLKMIRKRTGYDGFDDQIEGVDLPGELAEAFDYIDADEKKLRAQLAKAEQLVSEACAKWIDRYAGIHQKEMLSDTAKSFADALRRGEWRKFVKEV